MQQVTPVYPAWKESKPGTISRRNPPPYTLASSTTSIWTSVDVKVKLLRTKDKTCATLKAFIERAEVETGERVNYFRSDSGGEYGSKVLAQENGLAERTNRTIVEMARLLLKDANLPNSYWSFAVNYAVHIINRSPTRTLKNSLTPFEAYTGNKPSIAHLCIFGCKALGTQSTRKPIHSFIVQVGDL